MKTITLKLTDNECRAVNRQTRHIMFVERCIEDGNGGVIEVLNVDKFRKFLNDEIIEYKSDLFQSQELCQVELDNLKSILSKLDDAVVLTFLQKQITKVEEIDKDFCDMVAEGCNADEGDGQFYNGVHIDEDTILVLSTYFDRMSNSEDYFHYSISKDKLTPVDAEMDEKYRDLFEDCNMLDYTDCFYIMGVSPTKDNKAVIDYGDKYNDTIVNLDVVHNDEPKQIGKNKCCTEDNMEFIDMPIAMECEEYRCSKCNQGYTIPISVERHWDDIETGSYMETL